MPKQKTKVAKKLSDADFIKSDHPLQIRFPAEQREKIRRDILSKTKREHRASVNNTLVFIIADYFNKNPEPEL